MVLIGGEPQLPPSLEMEFFLHHHKSFFSRVVSAVKYVFGAKANSFCGFMMRHEDIPEFKKLLSMYDDEYRSYVEASN